MSSSPKRAVLRNSTSSPFGGVHDDRILPRSIDALNWPQNRSSSATVPSRVNQSIAVPAKKSQRILLVDASLVLCELHQMLLRSIPAIVRNLNSYAHLYFHKERVYSLVVLAHRRRSSETAEAAHFLHQRWSTVLRKNHLHLENTGLSRDPSFSWIVVATNGLEGSSICRSGVVEFVAVKASKSNAEPQTSQT